jgi:tetratricopeptide (TPR) repeat protein
VAEFPGGEQFTGLYIKSEASGPGDTETPGRVADIRLTFADASLSGTLSFTAPAESGNGTALVGDMDYKEEVLAIIDNYPLETERKAKLKQLQSGMPYQYLLRNVYPRLRVAVCKVNFNVKNFDVEEAKEVIKTRPQNLSLNEMFMVANSYPAGSQEFVDVFEVAVRMYPENEIANMNAAAAAILRKDLVAAERYLNKVDSKEPEYINSRGVVALLKGDYKQAEKYLKAAAGSGLEAAKDNLDELAKKKANIAEIEKTIR